MEREYMSMFEELSRFSTIKEIQDTLTAIDRNLKAIDTHRNRLVVIRKSIETNTEFDDADKKELDALLSELKGNISKFIEAM
jgi:hypothetical protein